jgi:formylglycine-generating enzyme required for sulfatase activity/dienelactone hydrolase
MENKRILESWKEVAFYLKRSEKTCRIWEHTLGLPVHRLDGSPKSRIFAYPEEIDRWLEGKLHERGDSSERTAFQRPERTRRLGIIGVLVFAAVAVGLPTAWFLIHQANIRWAKTVALAEIQRLFDKDDDVQAFKLVHRAEKYIPEDPELISIGSQIQGDVSVQTTPRGARVYIRDYLAVSGEWEFLGRSPLEGLKVRRGCKRWKIVMPGYETVEGVFFVEAAKAIPHFGVPAEVKVALDKIGTIPPGMARIRGEAIRPRVDKPTALPELQLGDYFLDRYEVTNRQFKEFVDTGGYEKPEYWDKQFNLNGRDLGWASGLKLFVDKTGRPGPAGWEFGAYPVGQDDYPVTGVSWYEAAAYSRFVQKSLPTIYHWCYALGNLDLIPVTVLSNFGEKGPARVGQNQGTTSWGIYDMAGNVREWAINEVPPGQRLVIGNSWNDLEYNVGRIDGYSPFLRDSYVGFRCMKIAGQTETLQAAAGPISFSFTATAEAAGSLNPCSDEVFRVYKSLYTFRKADMRAKSAYVKEISKYTKLEKVSFDAPYGDERMFAYLFIPRMGTPPFQTIIFCPGTGAWVVHSVFEYSSTYGADRVTKNGRAFVFPVLRGTFERKTPPEKTAKTTESEENVMFVKEIMRTIDYLETRPEFDAGKFAFEGISSGGICGSIIPAIDGRIKAAVLLSAGLDLSLPPEYSQINFSPRVKIPILMQNGKYDYGFLVETFQKPLFKLLGTPDKDKFHKIYDSGHSVWLRNECLKDELDFLDKYLGPVNKL